MKSNINKQIDEIYKEIGEFGRYQLLVFVLVGTTAFIPAFVGYSYTFYGATPNFRCKIPNLDNDTYEVTGDYHQYLIDKFIPPPSIKSFKDEYNKCEIRVYLNETNSQNDTDFKLQKCNQWVYSKRYFKNTLITDWNYVCDNTPMKGLFNTLYFIGTYGVLLNGFLSDKFGRKNAAYMFIVSNSILNIILTVLLSVNVIDIRLQQILIGAIRFLCGIASNVYAVAVVLAIEVCGPSKRVTAANFIYYFYILGEFLVVALAYLFKNDYRVLYAVYTGIMTLIVFYFWLVPESPRWLMTKKKYQQAYRVFKRIAISNKRSFDFLSELDIMMKKRNENETNNNQEVLVENHDQPEKMLSIGQTVKIFFKSRRLMIRSFVTLINWFTNTFVYYGISFNTTDLAGDPYLNFFLSALVELVAILISHYTLEKFGRKVPYTICMVLTGTALVLVKFVPSNIPILITILVLTSKFGISFTYNAIYIITSEMYPTVIRNSSVSICQSFARLGAVIAPSIQLLSEIYWYPLPYLVYGSCSIISAITFTLFMQETKNKKLPDTIDEFIQL